MDCSLQAPRSMGFSRREYWSGLLFPSPGESSQPRDWTQVSCIVGFTIWATKEAHEQPRQHIRKQRHHFAHKGPSSQNYGFSPSHIQRWESDHKEGWVPKNWCFWTVVLEKTLESPLDSKIKPVSPKGINPPPKKKKTLNIHWKDWCWSWSSSPLATWSEETTHWKRPWCWEGLWAGREGGSKGWDGWMASLTQWTWVWASPERWWRTGKPDMPQSMVSQRVRHDWATKQQQKLYI